MKCYNVSCRSNDIQEENNCCDYIDFLKSVCDNFISEDAYNIKQLQAELKVYKSALEMACEDLKSSLEFNYGYADEDLVNYFITKAKEA